MLFWFRSENEKSETFLITAEKLQRKIFQRLFNRFD